MWNQMPSMGRQQFPLLKQCGHRELELISQGTSLALALGRTSFWSPHSPYSLGATCPGLIVLAAAPEMASFLILSQPQPLDGAVWWGRTAATRLPAHRGSSRGLRGAVPGLPPSVGCVLPSLLLGEVQKT